MSDVMRPDVMVRAGLLLLLLATGGWDALRASDADVEKGNRAFTSGRYGEALEHYRSAEERGANPRLHFDMGAALYKLGEKSSDEAEKAKLFEQAEEQFRRAADTSDAALKSSAYYNLGNTMYRRAQWDEAISAYKRALRADPQNQSARYNLEMALRRRQKQPQQQQQQRPGPQGQQGQQGRQGQRQGQQPPQQGGEQGRERDQRGPDRSGPGQAHGTAPQTGAQDGRDRGTEQGGGGREPERGEESPSDQGAAESDSPSDQARKLDELERRSRDLRKRLLRQGGKNRDPLRLPSRRDW